MNRAQLMAKKGYQKIPFDVNIPKKDMPVVVLNNLEAYLGKGLLQQTRRGYYLKPQNMGVENRGVGTHPAQDEEEEEPSWVAAAKDAVAEEPVEEAPPQVNRLSEVMQAAVEQDRHIDQEYLVDLFQAFWSDVKDDVRRELVSQASVDNTEAILEKKLTSLGEQQIAQQSKHESALKVFNDFVGNKASRLGVSEDSIREDYQALADQVLTDPSMLTMQTGEEAGNLMLQRLNTLDKIIEKRTGSSPAPRSNQQNQAQLNSGNGKVYTPKRSNAIKMPVYPSEEESRYAFIQRVKQADRVIG